jgi:hypothetical protein
MSKMGKTERMIFYVATGVLGYGALALFALWLAAGVAVVSIFGGGSYSSRDALVFLVIGVLPVMLLLWRRGWRRSWED